ncbi:MAG: hypothetical protein LLF86_01870 [Nitrospiraceae bacterium]|nr:hypothetical protein [Nitrospiraceae bacterium]
MKRSSTSEIEIRPRHILLPFLIIATILLSSCSIKKPALPDMTGVSFSQYMARLNDIQSINASMGMGYEAGEITMSGDAALELTGSSLDMRIYHLGFLAAEIKEQNGVVNSKPRLSRDRALLLVDGIKYGFFWWRLNGFDLSETDTAFILANPSRKVVVDKKTYLPIEQTIFLDNGGQAVIHYQNPQKTDNDADVKSDLSWYQSEMTLKYKKHTVTTYIRSYTASKTIPLKKEQ